MTTTCICLSRAIGAGGDQIGRAIAQQLGYRFVDDEIVTRASERAEVPVELVEDAERRKGMVQRVLEALGTSAAADPMAYNPNIETFNPTSRSEAVIRDVIEEIANEGNCVINAHASAMQLGRRQGVFRVLITASPDVRARRIVDEIGCSTADADRALQDSDRERRDYFKRFHSVSEELPTHYDLVINTDLIGVDQATRLIIAAAS
jgi:cytidylate kinase